MSDLSLSGAQMSAPSAGKAAFALLIAVPFYRNERLVAPFMQALTKCAAELRSLNARVVLFNDSPDYEPLSSALAQSVRETGGAFDVSIRTNPQNLGWLKTCNLAMAEAQAAGTDIILFNSDTQIMPGAIAEMVRISRTDPMIGFVNPRSNNATLATFPPVSRPGETMDEQVARYRAASASLPDLTYVPTAVGFAMLIRNTILREFGHFDEVYGGGYNEENDLVMRASRCGYRAVLANHAYVWHEGEQSLGATSNSKQLMEEANRKILLSRYPEYMGLVRAWFDGVEHTVERLLPALTPDSNGRLDIAFDASHFSTYHNGTTIAGVQLLRYMNRLGTRFNLYILCDQAAYDFHGFAQTGVTRADPHGPERFAAIFRIGQPFDWETVLRMSQKAAVTGHYMLDTIALDCGHLYDPRVADLWDHVLTQSDFIVYLSEFTARQFELRFPGARRTRSAVALLSLNTADYVPAAGPAQEPAPLSGAITALPNDYILVIGNQYPHKSTGDAANRIATALPHLQVVALGVTKEGALRHGAGAGDPAPLGPQNRRLNDLPNLHGVIAGELSNADMTALHRRARVIVMPSHYEGFGIPLLDALAFERPFIARRLPPFLEINEGMGRDPNLHFFDTTDGLIDLLRNPPQWRPRPLQDRVAHDGERFAKEVADIISEAVSAATYSSILTRYRAIHTIFNARPAVAPPTSNAESAARRLGQAAERIMRPLFRVPAIYGGFQLAYRAARATRRSLTSLRRR